MFKISFLLCEHKSFEIGKAAEVRKCRSDHELVFHQTTENKWHKGHPLGLRESSCPFPDLDREAKRPRNHHWIRHGNLRRLSTLKGYLLSCWRSGNLPKSKTNQISIVYPPTQILPFLLGSRSTGNGSVGWVLSLSTCISVTRGNREVELWGIKRRCQAHVILVLGCSLRPPHTAQKQKCPPVWKRMKIRLDH